MNESTFKVVLNIPEWLGSWLTTTLSGLTVIITLYLFFRWRAGSSYGFLNRLYAIFIGGSEFHHDVTAKFWSDRKDIERFNALFNTKAKSLNDIQKFIIWIEDNELDLRKFTTLKDWFDFEKRKVKKPKKWQLATPFVFTLLAYISSIPISVIASVDAALIKFNDERQWIWLGHTEAKSFSLNPFRDHSNDWKLTKSDCSNTKVGAPKAAKDAQFQQKTINIICESFSNGEDSKQIDKIITEQNIFWLIAIILWLLTLYSFMDVIRKAGANHARSYLLNKLKKARLRKEVSAPT